MTPAGNAGAAAQLIESQCREALQETPKNCALRWRESQMPKGFNSEYLVAVVYQSVVPNTLTNIAKVFVLGIEVCCNLSGCPGDFHLMGRPILKAIAANESTCTRMHPTVSIPLADRISVGSRAFRKRTAEEMAKRSI